MNGWNQKVAFFLTLCLPVMGHAQLGPVEWTPEWGQAGWSNPALFHPSGGQVWLGGLAGTQVLVTHSGPNVYDFISPEGEVNFNVMLERMDSVETVGLRNETPLFALSFRDENRFEFRLRSRFVAEQQLTYDRDLFELGWKGNGHPDLMGRPLSFSDMGLDAQGYFDHGLSVGAMVQENKLWMGWGIHILNGVGSFETAAFAATLATDSVDYSLSLDGEMAIQASGLNLDSLLSGQDPLALASGAFPPTLGAGVAYDFGFLWKVTPQFSLEGAMEGRGSIRWLKSITRQEVDPAQFILEGLDAVTLLTSSDSLSLSDSLPSILETWAEDMVDSLTSSFAVQSTSESMDAFSTPIQETWRLGFRMRPTEALEFSGLVYRQFRFDRHIDGLMVGLTHRILGNVTTHIQAQYRSKMWSFGGGLSLRGGPVRLVVSAQHIPGLIAPLDAGHWQGQVGLGFEMGYKREKRRTQKKGGPGPGSGMWH